MVFCSVHPCSAHPMEQVADIKPPRAVEKVEPDDHPETDESSFLDPKGMQQHRSPIGHVHANSCDAPASFSLAALLPDYPSSHTSHDDCEIEIVFEHDKPEPPLFGAPTTSKFAMNDGNGDGADMETRISFDCEDVCGDVVGLVESPC